MRDHGEPLPREILDLPLTRVLRRRADEDRGDLACAFLPADPEGPVVRLTYGELDRAARGVAATLQGDGLEAGDRVLLVYPPGLDFVVAFLGCLYAGIPPATAYPPHPRGDLGAIRGILADCGAARLLTTGPLAAGARAMAAAEGHPLEAPLLATDDLSADAADAWRDPGTGPGDLAFLQYTSGSTGDPKGVMLSHRNLTSTTTDVHRGFEHTRDSVMVSWLPTFHDMGLIYGVLLPLRIGFPTYLMAPATFLRHPLRWLQALSRYGGTHTSSPDFGFQLCLRKVGDEQLEELDLSAWQVAANGAEAVRVETQEGFLRRFAPCGVAPNLFCPSYGLAEVGLKVATARRGRPMLAVHLDAAALEEHRLVPVAEGSAGSRTLVGCGTSRIGARIEIVDPDTLGPCPADRVGEIWVSSTSVAEGYWRRPELSDATFRAHTAAGDGPFLRTGDLGFLHQGQLFIAGRIKDLIVVRGRNHYSHDVERTMEAVDPVLRPGCGVAFGLEVDGEERLVVVQEVRPDAEADPEELLRRIRNAVAANHGVGPHAVALLPAGSVPKTSSGKLRRPLCRELYRSGRLPVLVRWQAGGESAAASA